MRWRRRPTTLIVVGRGRLVADVPTEMLLQGRTSSVRVRGPEPARLARVLTGAGATVEPAGESTLHVSGLEPAQIARVALEQQLEVHELVVERRSLEDAFLELTHDATDYRARPAHREDRDPMNDSLHVQAQPTPTTHGPGPTLARVTRSETVKLRTLRSNVVLVITATLFLLVMGPVQALGQVIAPQGATPIGDLGSAVSVALNGGITAALLLGVLGVLSVTSEFPTALVRTTFWAVPRRGLVVRGKALAFAGLMVPLVLASAAVAIEASRSSWRASTPP